MLSPAARISRFHANTMDYFLVLVRLRAGWLADLLALACVILLNLVPEFNKKKYFLSLVLFGNFKLEKP